MTEYVWNDGTVDYTKKMKDLVWKNGKTKDAEEGKVVLDQGWNKDNKREGGTTGNDQIEEPALANMTQDDDDDGDKRLNDKVEKVKKDEINKNIEAHLTLLPPLLPFKFGNGLLLQYIANNPSIDDKIGILEIGLYIGLTSLGLFFLGVLVGYLKKLIKKEQDTHEMWWMLNLPMGLINYVIFGLQVLLLVVLFMFCIVNYSSVDTHDLNSKFYVKANIYNYSLVISSIMFFSFLIATVVLLFLYCRTPSYEPLINSAKKVSDGLEAPQLMPLGLANALIFLYILKPPQDEIDDKVLLMNLALYLGSITILFNSIGSIVKIGMMIALRDGHIDYSEAKTFTILKWFEYFGLGVQFIMFGIMFSECIIVHVKEYKCPRNILLVCSVISGLIVMFSTVGCILILAFKCLTARLNKQTRQHSSANNLYPATKGVKDAAQ